MKGKRLWYTLRLYTIRSATKRANYLRKKKVFRSIGSGCVYQPRKVPLYPELIRLGNNVKISYVTFSVHDITHLLLNSLPEMKAKGRKVSEKIGCIDIGDNVFIGAGTTILGDVRIGSNVIIGANTLVNKDIPDNSVVGGVPAKVIGSFDAYMEKRLNEEPCPQGLRDPAAVTDWRWENFNQKRMNSKPIV